MQRAADRSRAAQRQRRRDRARASARLHRREAHDIPGLRNAAPRLTLRAGDDVRRRWNGRGRNLRTTVGGTTHGRRRRHGNERRTDDQRRRMVSGRHGTGKRHDAGEAHRRAEADRADGRGVRGQRRVPRRRTSGAEGLGAQSRAAQERRRARAARPECAGGVWRRRSRQDLGAPDLRAALPLRLVRRDDRRAGQSHDHADLHVRYRGAEAEVPAAARVRRDGRRVLPERIGFGIGRARRQVARRPSTGRQLRALGREDVDHQWRLRRCLHRLCQGRRRAVHRVHRRTQLARRVDRQGRAQAGAARLVDLSRDPAGRQGAGRRSARRDRQGPQGRVQRAQLRSVQARRDELRRLARGDSRVGALRRHPQAVRNVPSRRSARSSTRSARWCRDSTRSRACCIAPAA